MNRVRLTESDIHRIIKESVNRIVREAYTGEEPYVPNKYPGQMPKFNSKEQYNQWRKTQAPDDFFDWKDDRKWQRTGIQPSQSGLASSAAKARANGGMSWNNNARYNKFQQLKAKNGMQTESDLHRIVKESMNKVLNEIELGGESLQ